MTKEDKQRELDQSLGRAESALRSAWAESRRSNSPAAEVLGGLLHALVNLEVKAGE